MELTGTAGQADSGDHAAILADLNARMNAALAANRARLIEHAKTAAAIAFLEEPQRTLGYAALAAELYAPRTAVAR